MVGDRYSLADISLYAYTHVAHEGGFDLDPYPAIRNWLERVAAQAGARVHRCLTCKTGSMTSAAPDPTQLTCERCGATNPPHARFCHSCGARLDSDQAAQEERKLVSVLFVDLVGFTSRSDRADPEDVRDLLEDITPRRRADRAVRRRLEKFIGDAVMAVFGVPVSHGDDAERAVRAGLRVLEGSRSSIAPIYRAGGREHR